MQNMETTQNWYEEQEHSHERSDSRDAPHTDLRDRRLNQRATPEIESAKSTAGNDAQTTPELDSSIEVQRDNRIQNTVFIKILP